MLWSIGYEAYAADETNVYVLVVPRRSAAKPTVVKVEYVSGVWRVRAVSLLPLISVVAGACLLLLVLLWIATR